MKPVEIKIFNNNESVSISKHALKEYCHLIGFKRRETHKLGVLFEELLRQLIKCTFLEGQEGEIIIEFIHIEGGVEININDFGIPLDEESMSNNKDNCKHELSGIYNILHNVMDEVKIGAKGFKGNEIVLRKMLNSKRVHKVNRHESDDTPANSINPISEVKLLDTHLAADISKLAYIAYHYSYPYEDIYIPNKIREKMDNELLISAGAVLDDIKQVVSHSALSFSKPGDKTAELGVAFTDPNYRGHGFINKIWHYLINHVAKEKKLFGVYAMAVCTHPYSQKACHKMGMKDSALLISRAPIIEFESIDISNAQRESIMIALKIMEQPEQVVFYPPKHHKKMILEIAKNLDLNVQIRKHPMLHLESPHNFSNIEVKTDAVFSIAKLYIIHFGKNIQTQFITEFHKLKNNRYESIYLYLDLADYHTEKLTKYFESHGFFFAGIMHENNRMNLVLQYLNNQNYDFNLLKIDSDFGNNLLKYVEIEYVKREFD